MKSIGKGNTAEVFDYGDGRILKLFNAGFPRENVEFEYWNATEIYRAPIRAPKPYEIVTIDDRHGIIYEKITGETMLKLMQKQPETTDKHFARFIDIHKDIIAQKTNRLVSYKDFLLASLRGRKAVTPEISEMVAALPEGDNILHGDYHPDNILVTPEGEYVVIDFMNASRGPAIYDIARSYFILHQFNEAMGERYLRGMGAAKSEMDEYIKVIRYCRRFE